MQVLCDELGIKYRRDASPKQLHDKLNDYLLKSFSEGRSTVLIIDEAQLLDRDVLEQVRLLTNLETTKAKLLQIILIGQPELSDLLARNDLRQLSQRITARYHLDALEPDEVADYVAYRLGVAGCKQALFSKQALARVYKYSRGVPRLINVICDHAMLAAYSKDKYIVDASMINAAAKEVLASEEKTSRPLNWRWLVPVIPAVALVAVSSWLLGWWPVTDEVSAPPVLAVGAVPPVPAAPVVPAEPDPLTPKQAVVEQEVISPSYLSRPEPAPGFAEEDLATDPGSSGVLAEQAVIATAVFTESAVAPEERLVAILDQHGGNTTRETALSDLAGLWGKELSRDDGTDPCLRMGSIGLDCLPGTGGWNQLVTRDRPAMIVVADGPNSHNVVLASLEDKTAVLHIGDAEHRVPVQDILDHWTGESLTLWQPPVPSRVFTLGVRGADVIWLRTRLNEIADVEGINAARLDEINPDFDQALAAQVSAFQYRHGLMADGIVGAETMLRMNSVQGGGAVPSLLITPN
jgi:general secretion pathway protein A